MKSKIEPAEVIVEIPETTPCPPCPDCEDIPKWNRFWVGFVVAATIFGILLALLT